MGEAVYTVDQSMSAWKSGYHNNVLPKCTAQARMRNIYVGIIDFLLTSTTPLSRGSTFFVVHLLNLEIQPRSKQ